MAFGFAGRSSRARIELGIPDYAFNLADVAVTGSIILQPGFYAQGGVSVRGAHIGGDIRAEAAAFSASEKPAFRGESLRCDGAVALRAKEEAGEYYCQCRDYFGG